MRRLRPPAHEVHHGHAHVLVELAEELAADSEHLSEDERVLARTERETRTDDDPDGPGRRRTAGVPDGPSDATPATRPEDSRRE